MKVLKHRLKVSGLRQSPWRTPRPTVMKGVWKDSVTNKDFGLAAGFDQEHDDISRPQK